MARPSVGCGVLAGTPDDDVVQHVGSGNMLLGMIAEIFAGIGAAVHDPQGAAHDQRLQSDLENLGENKSLTGFIFRIVA